MTNFTPTLIAFIAIWIVLIGYHGYNLSKANRLIKKIKELES